MAYTVFDNRDTVFAALKAGAGGYILKTSTARQLVDAIYELRQGSAPMTPRIARAVIREFHQQGSDNDKSPLSRRELDVLQLIESGLSYDECASELGISRHTVHSHIKKLYGKLQAKNSRDAVSRARDQGFLT